MKNSDLMLGNWVWNDTQKVPVRVDIKILQEQWNADKGFGKSWDGIPLTEEILSKLGSNIIPFTKGGCIEFSRFRFVWKKEYNYWYVTDSVSKEYMTKISYVHEFQNFIKVMNNQEVIIRL